MTSPVPPDRYRELMVALAEAHDRVRWVANVLMDGPYLRTFAAKRALKRAEQIQILIRGLRDEQANVTYLNLEKPHAP